MEVRWPGLSGIDFVHTLAARLCEPRLVIFTACADYDTIVESVAAGALGYLIKPTIPGYLVAAVREAAQGRSLLCGQAQDAVTNLIRRIGASKRCRTLSWREREVNDPELGKRFRAPNKWPADLPGFREQIESAFGLMQLHS